MLTKLEVTLICLVLLLGGVGGWLIWNGVRNAGAVRQLVAAEQQKGAAVVNAAQSSAHADAANIIVTAQRHDALDITLHQDHADDLAATPGADAALDPRLNDAGRRRLCGYSTYRDDPGCRELRGGNTAVAPNTGGANTAPAA